MNLQATWKTHDNGHLSYNCKTHFLTADGVSIFPFTSKLALIKKKNDGRYEYTIYKSQYATFWNGVQQQGVFKELNDAVKYAESFWNKELLKKNNCTL